MLPQTHDWFVHSILFWHTQKTFGPELEENMEQAMGGEDVL